MKMKLIHGVEMKQIGHEWIICLSWVMGTWRVDCTILYIVCLKFFVIKSLKDEINKILEENMEFLK